MYESCYLKKLLYAAKPYLLLLLVFSFLAIFAIKSSRAADQTITCLEGGCSGISGALFNETNLTPGSVITRSLKVENNYSQERNFAVEIDDASFSDSTPSLSTMLTLKVKEEESGSEVYGPKTLEEWKNDGSVFLSKVPAGGVRNYDFEVKLADVDNDYQGTSLTFDLRFGFEALPSTTSSSTSSSSSSEGAVLGASVENLIGQVLGLSATGAGILRAIIFIDGVFLILAGNYFCIRAIRSGLKES